MFDDLAPALSLAVRIPADWSASARRMVEARHMTQADIDAVEADLVRFRRIRAEMRVALAANVAAYERHWRENEARLSVIEHPPVPHFVIPQEQAA